MKTRPFLVGMLLSSGASLGISLGRASAAAASPTWGIWIGVVLCLNAAVTAWPYIEEDGEW